MMRGMKKYMCKKTDPLDSSEKRCINSMQPNLVRRFIY